MEFLGRVAVDRDKRKILIDAQPFVMSRIRSFFSSQGGYNAIESLGKYTHKPILVSLTKDTAKDIEWIISRYPMEMDDITRDEISIRCEQYNLIQKKLKELAKIDNFEWKSSVDKIEPQIKLYPNQVSFFNFIRVVKRTLLADPLGEGKTYSALSVLSDPEFRPALIVVPPNLTFQWRDRIRDIFPSLITHIIPGFKKYDLPKVDVLITSYNRLNSWEDILVPINFGTIIFDEVHSLRHTDTDKWHISKVLSDRTKCCIGLSATPIINYGNEIWSVLNVINPGSLGTQAEFESEWCTWKKVRDPISLRSYLMSENLLVRRETTRQVRPYKQVITINSDLKSLEQMKDVYRQLAISVLGNTVGISDHAERELDFKLRMATGVAKAKAVAEFVKELIEQGEKVILVGWHREVYTIWLKELSKYNPVMHTGSESPKEKDEAVKKFIYGDSGVFILSLRSGAGLDGLQYCSRTMVIGELDWSGEIMNQCVGRIDRQGQTKPVNAYYLVVNDGADPTMMQINGVKKSQSDGVIKGIVSAQLLETESDQRDRVREMAKQYLQSIGEEIPEPIELVGKLGEIVNRLSSVFFPVNSEAEMQDAVYEILNGISDIKIYKEYSFGKKSRLDFYIESNDEKIAIECKINSRDRASVYRQVRRYLEELEVTTFILLAPWSGVEEFKVDGVKVKVIDFSKNNI